MKLNFWLLFGAMLSTSLLAQPVTNPPPASSSITNPPPVPAPASAPASTDVAPATPAELGKTNAPAAKNGKKKSAPKKKKSQAPPVKKDTAAELKTVPLTPGPAVVDANNVNVRGQAKLNSEVVTRLSKGTAVTVLDEVVRNNSGPSEPSAWAKILLPAGAHVWVNSQFIDGTNKTVIPKRLNLRSGPGENYSVLGRLEHGDSVKEVTTKGDWTQIEAPTNAFAFVAAQYLKQPPAEATAIVANTPEPKPAPATVTEPPPIAAAPKENPTAPIAATETPASTNTLAAVPTPSTEPPAPAIPEPPPKRIVQREGVVRGTFSIQAPTHFELVSPESGRVIDYLYTSSPNLDLRRYKGLRIVVTGEEGLEERWGNTPVITIQRIQVLEEPSAGRAPNVSGQSN